MFDCSNCSNCGLNIKGTCRAMPLTVNPESPRLIGIWPPVAIEGWCSWHKFSLWKFLRWGDGTARA